MDSLLDTSWVVAVGNYESPSRFGVSVEPAEAMIRRNLGALQDCVPPPTYVIVGLFDNEESAREWGRRIQAMRNDRADIQDLLTRRPSED
ncbi:MULTISPECIES: hypothetical protein [unclassified Cupriavidus]|uniref:hypothetical protein n=1 Tax=unclassified Cupriavidus TaxID=2640874 RepID=UPI00313BB310